MLVERDLSREIGTDWPAERWVERYEIGIELKSLILAQIERWRHA